MRRVYAVFGTLGIAGYLGYLAQSVFKDSMLFPFALSLIGVAIIAAGLFYHSRQAAIADWLARHMPEALARLRPAHARPDRYGIRYGGIRRRGEPGGVAPFRRYVRGRRARDVEVFVPALIGCGVHHQIEPDTAGLQQPAHDAAGAAQPRGLEGNHDLDLAVARGAAYYALVKAGKGVRIRGGTPRTYYVGIETAGLAITGAPRPLRHRRRCRFRRVVSGTRFSSRTARVT